jgi:hypothetical protein
MSRLTMATLLAAGFALVPVTISNAGQVEEAGVCAAGGACRFEIDSVCEASNKLDYYETAPDVVE